MGQRKFAYIPHPNDQYFEREKLFGEEVDDAFPEARVDIKDAGNCIAAELYTAAVYHLMRAAEYGPRRLARKLRVSITDKGKRSPVDYAAWTKVIDTCKSKINAARQLPAGPKKQRRLEAYSQAADHCTYMKAILRNSGAHARDPYDKLEALQALRRVRDFMNFLAPTIGAGKRLGQP